MGRQVRRIRSSIIVTYPDGRCAQEPVWIYYDPALKLFEFLPTGDNPLKGYLSVWSRTRS